MKSGRSESREGQSFNMWRRVELTRREDADSRVVALKARMDALKKRREARPAKKAGKVNGK